MLISTVQLSCFSPCNLKLQRAGLNPVLLAFLCRRPKWKQWSCNLCNAVQTLAIYTIISANIKCHSRRLKLKFELKKASFISSVAHMSTRLLTCEHQKELYMCDGLFYNAGQIFKLNVTTTSGLNKPESVLQLVVEGKMGTKLSLDVGRRVKRTGPENILWYAN